MSAISIQTDVMSNPGEESGLLRSKTSVLGRVPKEWEVVNLSDVFQLKQGIQCAVENQSRQRREGYKRFIRIIDLTNPDESCRYIEDPGPAHHLGLNDLFMVRYGSPGLLGLGYEGVIANNLFRLLPKRNLDSLFYYHYLGSRQKDIAELSGSSTMAAVSFSSLRNLSLIYPPIAEQRVIGGVLSDLDTLLNSLGTLIAKKKAIKQGAMQQLLTGKQRLPGFEGEWEVTSLDEVAYRVTGFWGSSDGDPNAPRAVGIIRAGDISPEGKLIDTAPRYLSEPAYAKAKCDKADIVITVSGNGLGKVWLCDGRPDVCASNFVRVLKPKGRATGAFLYYQFATERAQRLLTEYTATSAYPNLRPNFFNVPWVPLPPLEEQSAIATVLSDMDAELEALAARRAKTALLKQGMMQELLTGRTRLV